MKPTHCKRKPGRPFVYDWDRLFQLKIFTLRKGVHYRHSPVSMAQQVRIAASKRRLSVHLVESEGTITVTVKGSVSHAND